MADDKKDPPKRDLGNVIAPGRPKEEVKPGPRPPGNDNKPPPKREK
jgi:hypothetical protein